MKEFFRLLFTVILKEQRAFFVYPWQLVRKTKIKITIYFFTVFIIKKIPETDSSRNYCYSINYLLLIA